MCGEHILISFDLAMPYNPERLHGEHRGYVRRFAHAVIDAGADLVKGYGSHVLRAMEQYKGRLIAYSLGNFLVYERFNITGPSGMSIVLQAGLDPETGEFMAGRLVPVRIVGEDIPEIDPDGKALKTIMDLTKRDFPIPGLRIDADGTLSRLRQ